MVRLWCGATKRSAPGLPGAASDGRPVEILIWSAVSHRSASNYYGGGALDFGGVSGKNQPWPREVCASWEREMDNLIARVATAANITPEIARKAVALIGDFIQREAPEEAVRDLFDKATDFPAIIASSTSTGGEGMGIGLKGLMGVASGAMGGGGLMALGSELMGLGLGMDQIQTVGKEVFDFMREVAGDETVGEIAASIPGLSQFI
jgi:hypothetical protein